jgi:exodeoxyribonuclease VII small subunit
MSENEQTPDFETALKTLEALVERMEGGELTLEQSLQCFEQGIQLTRECQKALSEAEQRVEILTGKDPDAEPQPFEADDDAGAE